MIRFRLRVHLHEHELPVGTTVLGRADTCNLSLDDALLSREHASIRVHKGAVTIRDLGSRNGTWVNGEQIAEPIELRDGDRIRVGSTDLVFSRVVATRRALSTTTAALANCGSCGQSFVARAPSCPHCGVSNDSTGERRTKSQGRRDFWLSLEVELLEKALDIARLDEAEDSMRRMQAKLDELIDVRKKFDRPGVERALVVAIRYACGRGDARVLGWALSVLRRLDLLPGPALFSAIASTPAILLDDVRPHIDALVAAARLRGNTPEERSCLASLEAIARELAAFNELRSLDTAPRAVNLPPGAIPPELDSGAGAAARV